MATDVQGWECINHFYGPPFPCSANRFYPLTDCNPPRFFNYVWFHQIQPAWLWLNNVNWMEVDVFNYDLALWKYNVYVAGTPEQFSLRYLDNPAYNPVDPQSEPFLARITVTTGTILVPVSYHQDILFGEVGAEISRDRQWGITEAAWIAHPLNPPGSVPPRANTFLSPQLCQPNWDPTVIPRP